MKPRNAFYYNSRHLAKYTKQVYPNLRTFLPGIRLNQTHFPHIFIVKMQDYFSHQKFFYNNLGNCVLKVNRNSSRSDSHLVKYIRTISVISSIQVKTTIVPFSIHVSVFREPLTITSRNVALENIAETIADNHSNKKLSVSSPQHRYLLS
jgi:hypothetical protein